MGPRRLRSQYNIVQAGETAAGEGTVSGKAGVRGLLKFAHSNSNPEPSMKQIIFVVVLSTAATLSTSVAAKADCKAYPKAEWMKEADAKAKIEAQGYTINKFKVDGNCYEIYGKNKEGKKVEIYYDAKTLEPVKSEVEK